MIRVRGVARLPRLTALKKAVTNTEPIGREVANRFERELKRNIILQGIWGRHWPREAPNTAVKHRYEGKPAGLLRGLMDRIYVSHGKTQATFGFNSKYAQMHHEGRDFSWIITPRNKKILFFPVAGRIVKKRTGGTYHRLTYSESGGERTWIGRKKTRAPKTLSATKWERFNMVRAKRVTHPGFQARELLPPPEVVRQRTMEIVDEHIKRARA